MANLLDTLRNSNQAATAPLKAEDTTQGLSTLLRAKSGKATGGLSGALSNQAEQAAMASGNQGLAQQAQANTIAAQGQQQQQAATKQQTQQNLTSINQQKQASSLQSQVRTDQLLQDLEQNKGKIDAQQYQANLEQVGQNLRLSNSQYVDNLTREGARARLDDANAFKEALVRSTFNDNQNILNTKLGNKTVLNADQREWDQAMGQMTINDAYDMFKSGAANESARAQASGIGSVLTSGIAAAGTAMDIKEKNEAKKLAADKAAREEQSPRGRSGQQAD